jgi:hypothetical protein
MPLLPDKWVKTIPGMCLCIALKNLAGWQIANPKSVNGAVALQHPPPGQRRHQRRLLH